MHAAVLSVPGGLAKNYSWTFCKIIRFKEYNKILYKQNPYSGGKINKTQNTRNRGKNVNVSNQKSVKHIKIIF